ncbi:hypothetical protein K431DRAFT_286881 [Polychaeton citri CBS 116435]|uniref:PH domain-containing protein n=1 Tax=Polychaeton citri CBS 116435 TaxID=1314669 RepID=A0A9P4UKQ4_9PEZI|nr:hypothetical protein K431DRAFT_286881 [Polychaeton citri CBS 116435]
MSTLPATSHTVQRLEHSTPEHIHSTTTRLFVGPIPEGWLRNHRKQWYKQYFGDGRSKRPSFTAAHEIIAEDAQRHGGARGEGENEDGDEDRERQGGEERDLASSSAGTAPVSRPASGRPSSQSGDMLQDEAGQASTTSLLHSARDGSNRGSLAESARPSEQTQAREQQQAAGGNGNDEAASEDGELDPKARPYSAQRHMSDILFRPSSRLHKPRVHFDESHRFQLRARAKRMGGAARGKLRLGKVKEGEVLKTDKMLVRVDITQQTLPEDFDEKASLGVETRTLDKWREFMVVCRKHTAEHSEAVLQFYKTRVIAANEDKKTRKSAKIEIPLEKGKTRVSLFSSLDKMLCVWTSNNARTTIYYLRAESSASSVEWFTFLRGALGLQRADMIQVNVPDLSVSLRLDDPFSTAVKGVTDAIDGDDDALVKAFNDEAGVAAAIVTRCIDMLADSTEWRDVLNAWANKGRIGLAWKRYDRLEWIYGAIEQRMYGTIAMQRTHDLQLRPKDHYAQKTTVAKKHGRKATMEEPFPIEGFLIRLTSQHGHNKQYGKMLFKRLYFASQSQFLLFMRPAKARPPPPPKMPQRTDHGDVPSSKKIEAATPLSYEVDPYPLDADGKISWWDEEGIKPASDTEAHDQQAADEAQRNIDMLLECDGFVDLCDVLKVRKMHRGSMEADEDLDSGSDVNFSSYVHDQPAHDGTTGELDELRTFELLLRNGLVIRLQAYDQTAKKLWIKHLSKLVVYWRSRAKMDMDLYKTIRQENLQALGLDEKAEAEVGQYAQKWEVTQSLASSQIYNLCGIARCRAVHMSGLLFRKPRRHTTFTRCHCILSAGHLLVFQDTLRKQSGRKIPNIHHERIASIDLHGCYLYSGTLAENELLYHNQTFDANDPGHHALPKLYLEDGWTSTDEDANTTFVIWHPTSKQWFRSSQTQDDVKTAAAAAASRDEGQGKANLKLKRVSQLGVKGRNIVFKARSRAERDHWVLSLQVEIERLISQTEGVRLVDE